jgi:hypothetical protein
MTEYPDSILRVEYRSDKPIAVLTFDAPPLNIITVPTREHFGAVFREIETNDEVRAIIVRGGGEQLLFPAEDSYTCPSRIHCSASSASSTCLLEVNCEKKMQRTTPCLSMMYVTRPGSPKAVGTP